jgi:hypothetical protein
MYPLNVAIIRLYIREDERAIFTPSNLQFEISNFTVYGSNEIYKNFTVKIDYISSFEWLYSLYIATVLSCPYKT